MTEEKFVAPHDVRDIVEGRGVEFHDTVPSDRLVDALVQGLELSPELHRISVRARVHPRVCCRGEDVSGEVLKNLTLICNVLLEIVRVNQRQKGGGRRSEYCLWFC